MPRTNGLWSEEEERVLLEMLGEGAHARDVAKALGRSQEAVSARRLRLANGPSRVP